MTENGAVQDLNVTTVDSVMIKVSKSLEHISHLFLVYLNITVSACFSFLLFSKNSSQWRKMGVNIRAKKKATKIVI